MAGSRFNEPIEPMTLQNMRDNGVRSLSIQCHQCRRAVVWTEDGLHQMRDHRRRRQAVLAGGT
jgi:hypothetical protein